MLWLCHKGMNRRLEGYWGRVSAALWCAFPTVWLGLQVVHLHWITLHILTHYWRDSVLITASDHICSSLAEVLDANSCCSLDEDVSVSTQSVYLRNKLKIHWSNISCSQLWKGVSTDPFPSGFAYICRMQRNFKMYVSLNTTNTTCFMKSTKVQTLSAVALHTTTDCTDGASIVGLGPLNWAIV